MFLPQSNYSYWNDNGRYQKDFMILKNKLDEKWIESESKSSALRIFNAFVGIWYAYYNDGDFVEGAIGN